MNEHNHCSQEQSICRLVDNQLSESDRAELLLAAEREPELWRKITLAFIEEQVWSSAICTESSGTVERQRSNKSLSLKKESSLASPSPLIKPWWLALAAAALIAVTVTVRMSSIGDTPGSNSVAIDPELKNVAVNNEPYMLEMGDRQVPLFEQADSMSDFLERSEGQLDPALLQQLQTAGLAIEPRTRYITGNAPDGRSFVVPVKQFSVRSRFQ